MKTSMFNRLTTMLVNLAMFAAVVSVLSFPTMWMWNYVVPSTFTSVSALDLKQTFWGIILLRILFPVPSMQSSVVKYENVRMVSPTKGPE